MAEASTFVGAVRPALPLLPQFALTFPHPAQHYILGSWYHPHELGKRSAIFACSGQAASLFSGSLMARLYTLHDEQEIAGWQWQFIVCGIITIPIALYGFWAFPDTPSTTRTRLLNAEERTLAISRLPPRPKTRLEWSLIKRVLGRWHVWALSVVWVAGGALESYGAWGIMALWMKAQRVVSPTTGAPIAAYTVKQLNYYPLGIVAVSIAALLITKGEQAVVTDHYPAKRYAVNLLVSGCALVYGIVPLVGAHTSHGQASAAVPTAAWFFAFYLSGVSYAGQMSNFTWANEIAFEDEQERGVLLATMNVVAYAFSAWFQPVFWPASDAPHFVHGFRLTVAFAPILVVATCVTRYLQVRDERRRRSSSDAAGETVIEREKDKLDPEEMEGQVQVQTLERPFPCAVTGSIAAPSLPGGSLTAAEGSLVQREKEA
ncbi:hypothetical protein JCM10213v2_007414 [Rhodosporidiobolus nylandii]